MLRWFLADLRTGRQILDLPVVSGRWQRLLNRPETLECTVDLRDPDVQALHVRNTAAVAKTILAVAEGDVVLAAGPIWAKSYQRDDSTVTLSARGVWSYYDHRHILPLLAATLPVTDFTVPDPDESGKTMPNPAVKTSYNGFELGTIAKKLVQQAHAWTGGSLPVVFEADRVAAVDDNHERNYEGSDFKVLGDVLRQLQEVENGPDIRFMPRFTSDKLGIEWVLQTGTETQPLLFSNVTHRWDATAKDSPVSNFRIDEDGSSLADLGWVTGGRAADEVLVSRRYSTGLVGRGYPLFEALDSSRSSVVKQATLDRHAAELVNTGSAPFETWQFDVEANVQPLLTQYWEGDFIELDFRPYGSDVYTAYALASAGDGFFEAGGLFETQEDFYSPGALVEDPDNPGFYINGAPVRTEVAGDPYLVEGGTFRQRIIAIGGDERGETVSVQCEPRRAV
jgi:hypothetical protein